MRIEVWFKPNGQFYEALKGRQPDFKDIFERHDNKPKLTIGPKMVLRAYGTPKIELIERINGVYVELNWDSQEGCYTYQLSEAALIHITEFSTKKKFKHLLIGTPKPKLIDITAQVIKAEEKVYGTSILNDQAVKAGFEIVQGGLAYKPPPLDEKPSDGSDHPVAPQPIRNPTYSPNMREKSDVWAKEPVVTVGEEIVSEENTRKDIDEITIGTKAPAPTHKPLREQPVFRWEHLTGRNLTGQLILYGEYLDIEIRQNPGRTTEIIYVTSNLEKASQATSDLLGHQLAIEGSILPPLAVDITEGAPARRLATVISIAIGDAIRLRFGGRTCQELDTLHRLRNTGKWNEWEALMKATTRPRPASLQT